MRDYEVVVVLKPDIEDDDRNALIERLESWMTLGDEDAAAPSADHWGLRPLAYEIDKYREGYYIFYDLQLDPTKIGEMERNFTYQEDVLRHLVVRKVS